MIWQIGRLAATAILVMILAAHEVIVRAAPSTAATQPAGEPVRVVKIGLGSAEDDTRDAVERWMARFWPSYRPESVDPTDVVDVTIGHVPPSASMESIRLEATPGCRRPISRPTWTTSAWPTSGVCSSARSRRGPS